MLPLTTETALLFTPQWCPKNYGEIPGGKAKEDFMISHVEYQNSCESAGVYGNDVVRIFESFVDGLCHTSHNLNEVVARETVRKFP